MEESSMEKRRQDRYLKAAEQKKQRQKRNIVIIAIIAAVVCVSLLLVFLWPQKGVYRTLCDDGYTGTQEQLIASLVGEEVAPQGDTAYELAVKSGYKKTKADWMRTLTGAETVDENL